MTSELVAFALPLVLKTLYGKNMELTWIGSSALRSLACAPPFYLCSSPSPSGLIRTVNRAGT
jgi:hypothetical protein